MLNKSITISAIIRYSWGYGWDRPAFNLSTNEEYCYHFSYASTHSFNWFEAFRFCTESGGVLFYPESATEENWLWRVLNDPTIDRTGNHANDGNAVGWFINAHQLLYHENYSVGANGRSIYDSLNILYYSAQDSTPKSDCEYTYLDPCYYLTGNSLINIDCGQGMYNVGYICKKSSSMKNNTQINPTKLDSCPDGWIEPSTKVTPDENYYMFSKNGDILGWDSALWKCRTLGGELLTIETSEEALWIKNKLGELGSRGGFSIINYHRYLYDIWWSFPNKKTISDFGLYWAGGEPSNNCNRGYCAHMSNSGDGSIWENVCSVPRKYNTWPAFDYICKKSKYIVRPLEKIQDAHCDCNTNKTESIGESVYSQGYIKKGTLLCKSSCRCLLSCEESL